MNERIFCVYMHKNKINGKVYIGATSLNPKERWANGKGYVANKEMYADILQDGWDNFEHIIIIDNLNQEQSQVLERYYISKYKDNCYNKQIGGEQRTLKPKVVKSTRKQIDCNKSYYERHKEEIIKRSIKRQQENREQYNALKKKYYYDNEEYRQRKIQYQRDYRAKKKLQAQFDNK